MAQALVETVKLGSPRTQRISSLQEHRETHAHSIEEPNAFWWVDYSDLGNTTTLAEPSVVQMLIDKRSARMDADGSGRTANGYCH